MRKRNERDPRTKKRFVVYLIDGKREIGAGSYKVERHAEAKLRKLRRKYGHIGYGVGIRTIDKLV